MTREDLRDLIGGPAMLVPRPPSVGSQVGPKGVQLLFLDFDEDGLEDLYLVATGTSREGR